MWRYSHEKIRTILEPHETFNILSVTKIDPHFSVRAATIARMATSTDASRMVIGGLLLLVLLPTVTSCLRARRVSTPRITITAVTVLPFAVWYGRGEPHRRRVKKKFYFLQQTSLGWRGRVRGETYNHLGAFFTETGYNRE